VEHFPRQPREKFSVSGLLYCDDDSASSPYVSLVLAHHRRRIVHFGVTAHPSAEWTAQQLREAFPWETAPRYLLRDRDRIFGLEFVNQVKAMGIKQVLAAPRSPW